VKKALLIIRAVGGYCLLELGFLLGMLTAIFWRPNVIRGQDPLLTTPHANHGQSQSRNQQKHRHGGRHVRDFFFIHRRAQRSDVSHLFRLVVGEVRVEESHDSRQKGEQPGNDQNFLHAGQATTIG